MFVLCLGTHCKMWCSCHMVCKTWILIVGFALRGDEANCHFPIFQKWNSVAILPSNPHKLHVFLNNFTSCQGAADFCIPNSFYPLRREGSPWNPRSLLIPVVREDLGTDLSAAKELVLALFLSWLNQVSCWGCQASASFLVQITGAGPSWGWGLLPVGIAARCNESSKIPVVMPCALQCSRW